MVVICKTIKSLRDEIKLRKKSISKESGKDYDEVSVAFVPTMGYLHRGHISLVETAKKYGDIVVASIFVNPTQFGPNEDFASYPTDHDSDIRLLKAASADLLFLPSVDEIYTKGANTFVEVDMSNVKESIARPGHFRGVATVVSKLINIVQPNTMLIGQKDAMQCVCLTKLVRDLAFDTRVVIGETVRESNGLAMSSRNSYLTPEELSDSSLIYRSMSEVKSKCSATTTYRDVVNQVQTAIETNPKMKVAYVSLASKETGLELAEDQNNLIDSGAILSLAVFYHGSKRITRLIDAIFM